MCASGNGVVIMPWPRHHRNKQAVMGAGGVPLAASISASAGRSIVCIIGRASRVSFVPELEVSWPSTTYIQAGGRYASSAARRQHRVVLRCCGDIVFYLFAASDGNGDVQIYRIWMPGAAYMYASLRRASGFEQRLRRRWLATACSAAAAHASLPAAMTSACFRRKAG